MFKQHTFTQREQKEKLPLTGLLNNAKLQNKEEKIGKSLFKRVSTQKVDKNIGNALLTNLISNNEVDTSVISDDGQE